METNNQFTVRDLFSEDSVPNYELALEQLTANREQLEEVLTQARYAMERARERIASTDKRATRADAIAYAIDDLRDYDRRELVKCLQDMHADSPKLTLESGQWLVWCRLIVSAGIWAGNASDVHGLMVRLDETLGKDTATAIWHEVSADLRNEDGTYPDPVSAQKAVAMAWRKYWGQLEHHPSDPRLSDGWEIIWREAKRAGLCDTWDTMAEMLGVPPVTVTKSGSVTVSGTFSVNVYVEGVIDDEIDISLDDVLDNLDRYSIEIDDWDTSDLEAD